MKKSLKLISKIISTAIFVILIMIISAIILYLVHVKYLESQNKLGEVKFNLYTILTQSMYPTIEAGDIIITYKNKDNIYRSGDIITFISESNVSYGLTITHRVEEVFVLDGKYAYKTKGDANNTSDMSLTHAKAVIGKVVFRIPKAGYLQQFLVTGTGWIVAILIPALGIIISDILKAAKKASKKKEKTLSVEKKENGRIVIESSNNTKETKEEVIDKETNNKKDIL